MFAEMEIGTREMRIGDEKGSGEIIFVLYRGRSEDACGGRRNIYNYIRAKDN